MSTYNVYIVDDNVLIRQAYRQHISMATDLSVCGEAATCREALPALLDHEGVDIVLVDLRLEDEAGGINLIRRLQEERPEMPTVAITAHVKPIYRQRALEAGASRFLDKKDAADTLIPTLQTVLGES